MPALTAELPSLNAAPPWKFLGGKRQLLPAILPRLPSRIRTYFEPFVGGGAVFFALANERRFERAVLGDVNGDLINAYVQLRDDLPGVVRHLRTHVAKNCESHFYEQRGYPLNRRGSAPAARFIYLLKTSFNGLWRVNLSGEPNAPWGYYKNPKILDVPGLKAVSAALQGVEIIEGDFAPLMARARVGDAAYLDPPYLPVSKTANFTSYSSGGFGVADAERLAKLAKAAAVRGAHVLLSNADTAETRRIFGEVSGKIDKVSARRHVNSNGAKRGAVGELLVTIALKNKAVI